MKYYERFESRPIFETVDEMLKWAGLYNLTTRTLQEELIDVGLSPLLIKELVTVRTWDCFTSMFLSITTFTFCILVDWVQIQQNYFFGTWFGKLSMVMLLGCFGFLKCLHTDRKNYKRIKWFIMTCETWMDQWIYLLVEYSWIEDFEMVDLRNKKF